MKNKRNILNNAKKGFTLIEILVVIAIIGILSAIVLVNNGQNADRDARFQKDRFVTFLRDIQNRSLTAEKPSVYSATCPDLTKICGFGVHFDANDKTHAVMYFVQITDPGPAGDNVLDLECTSQGKEYLDLPNSPPSCYEMDDFYLGNDMEFGGTPKDLYFAVPHGDVTYSDETGIDPDTDDPIYIKDTAGTLSPGVDVVVRPSGLIE